MRLNGIARKHSLFQTCDEVETGPQVWERDAHTGLPDPRKVQKLTWRRVTSVRARASSL